MDEFGEYDYDNPLYSSWAEIFLDHDGVDRLCKAEEWNNEGFRMATDFVANITPGNGYRWRIKVRDPARAVLLKLSFGVVI